MRPAATAADAGSRRRCGPVGGGAAAEHAPVLAAGLRGARVADPASRDFRRVVPRFTPEARKANRALVDLLGRIATHRLEENLGAARLELTADDLRDIDGAASRIAIQGDRYPEELERRTGK